MSADESGQRIMGNGVRGKVSRVWNGVTHINSVALSQKQLENMFPTFNSINALLTYTVKKDFPKLSIK